MVPAGDGGGEVGSALLSSRGGAGGLVTRTSWRSLLWEGADCTLFFPSLFFRARLSCGGPGRSLSGWLLVVVPVFLVLWLRVIRGVTGTACRGG